LHRTIWPFSRLLEKVTFSASPIDSVAALSALFKRSQVVPNPARDYKLRFRAKNHRSFARPVGRIVSATKAGTTTTTILFDQPHGLTTSDQVIVHGIRDQTNFANLATPTAVASVPDASRITIAMGAAATAETIETTKTFKGPWDAFPRLSFCASS